MDCEEYRFLADNMLGKLARWLRMMGYDTLYARSGSDAELALTASREGRILLTRDKGLAARKDTRALYVESDSLDEQLAQVVSLLGLSLRQELRCTECNGPLEAVSHMEVAGRIRESVAERHSEFYMCIACKKIYWKGSHWTSIEERINRIMRA